MSDNDRPTRAEFRRLARDFDLVPRSVFFGNPARTQGRISPDGTKMSFLAPVDGVLNVWVGPLGDFDAARPITQDTGSGIDSHQWALNSKNRRIPTSCAAMGSNQLVICLVVPIR